MANRILVGIVFSPTLNIPAQVFSMFLHEYKHIFVRPDDNLPDDRDTPHSPFQEHQEHHEERRPSVPSAQYMNSLKQPGTPGLNSPFPPHLQQAQEPQTPRTAAASYEPTYEVFTPSSAPDMGFPRTPSYPPPGEGHPHQGGYAGSSLTGPPMSGKARRRESSMMFMMSRNKSPFAPQG